MAWGGRKAWTPLAMASTPVRALQPDANARRSTSTPIVAAVPGVTGDGVTAWGRVPVASRTMPITIVTLISAMNP